ncbi:unnamed protein product [Brachionus calyciflorus]|uniref:Uncharacterized protein n=1 Tax=Brachionus calyciflorus TaxID=104777 RepID=A0A814D038_9BILA|nr:unnamed protein product [Brachionus calyciflorus]
MRYTKTSNTNSNELKYHWPIDEFSVKDVLGGADLYGPVNAKFTENRFRIANSALRLESGYYNLPIRDYFSGDFTLMVWLRKPSNAYDYERIIDCGPVTYDSVSLMISKGSSNKLFVQIKSSILEGSMVLGVNLWYHVTFVLKENICSIYVNGRLDAQGQVDFASNVNRTNCYLGKSLWDYNPNVKADFDDLKIFKKSLEPNEVFEEYLKS